MDVRQLRYLIAVIDAAGFARAAERLSVAQSALSRQIRLLEDEVGVRLVERNKRAVVRPTPAGALFLPAAREALDRFDRVEELGLRLGRGEVGRIKVGYVASAIFSSVLAEVTSEFRRRCPDVEIEVVELPSPGQLAALDSGRIDVGFLRPQSECPPEIETVVVQREPVIVALHRDHPLASPDRALTAHDLAGERFVVPLADDEGGFARFVGDIARRGGFTAEVAHRTQDFVSVLSLVGLGFGVAAVPTCFERVRPAEVVYRRLADCDLLADLAGGFRRHERSPVVAAFIRVLRDLARRNA